MHYLGNQWRAVKILADENIPMAREVFGSLGELVLKPGRTISAQDLLDVDALIVRSVTRVNESLLRNSSVGFVGTCTIGIDHLDLDYFQNTHIQWASAPGCNATSVVEYVLSALSALSLHGKYLREKTVAIVGCGNVGSKLLSALTRLNVKCCVYDPFLSEHQCLDLVELNEALACDIICLHTPLTFNGDHPTFHMIGEREISALAPGTVLINAGRGGVINNSALRQRLEDQNDLTVVLDVWESEPDIDLPLMDLVTIATPHIAGYSYDGKVKGTYQVYQALCEHLARLNAEAQHKTIDLYSLLPALNVPVLHWSGNRIKEDAFAYIRQSYDVLADDKHFRLLMHNSAQPGIEFDVMRKKYAVRREFGNYFIPAQVNGEMKELLLNLGFMDLH